MCTVGIGKHPKIDPVGVSAVIRNQNYRFQAIGGNSVSCYQLFHKMFLFVPLITSVVGPKKKQMKRKQSAKAFWVSVICQR